MPWAPETQTTVAVCLAGIIGCEKPHSSRDAFLFEAERVREIASACGAQVQDLHPVVRDPLRVTQEWNLDLPSPWSHFEAQISSALGWTYICTSTPVNLHCSRAIPGDRFSLDLTPVGDASTRSLTVRLVAIPD